MMALTLEFRPHNSRARRHDLVIITQIGVQRDEPVAGDLAAARVDSDGVIHPMAKLGIGTALAHVAVGTPRISARRRRRFGLVTERHGFGRDGLLPEPAASAEHGGLRRAGPADRGGGGAHG
jgi:hypothetical protein